HLYTEQLSFEGAPTDGKSCLNRIVAADELGLSLLSIHEQKFLITNRSEWLRNNFLLVYKVISNLSTLELLRDFCLQMLCQDPKLLLSDHSIHLVDDKTLSILLKMDALQMDELSIWHIVIQWGISKIPYLSESNVAYWTQDDWDLLKSRLINIIPLVRFEHISRRDLYKYVKPFSNILPKDILAIIPSQEYDNTLSNKLNNVDNKENMVNDDNKEFISNDIKDSKDSKGSMLNFDNKEIIFNDNKGHMLNADDKENIDIKKNIVNVDINKNNLNVSNVKRSQQIDSIIISISHLPQISDWIKGNPDDGFPIHFNFSLIFRASRDGYAPGTFHRWCDDYGAPTLIVIKLTDSCQIIGGYNCFSWKSPLIFATTQHDERAFIFSLCDKDGNREKAKIARPKRIKKKHYNSKKCNLLSNSKMGNLLSNSKMGNLICNSKKGNFMKATKDHFISPGPSLKFSRFLGPCFGKSDLQLQNRLCYFKQRDYDDNITDHSGLFEVDDFEIFRVEICQK
ncbi:19354_t:CDS:1, partial [Racocetra persica]